MAWIRYHGERTDTSGAREYESDGRSQADHLALSEKGSDPLEGTLKTWKHVVPGEGLTPFQTEPSPMARTVVRVRRPFIVVTPFVFEVAETGGRGL